MNNTPLVSVCIPVFNGEKTIDEAIQSIINQTYQNIEIIVSDNASTDKTLKQLSRYNDPRILIYHNKISTSNGESNWDKCIELANGEYIAIFHADDVYSPDIIEKEVKMFQKYPDIGAVFTEFNVIDETGKQTSVCKHIPEFKGNPTLNRETVFLNLLKYGNTFLCCSSAMVKSEIYKDLYPFKYDEFCSSSDLDMWLRILNNHNIVIIDEKLMNYRHSKTQGSAIINRLRIEKRDKYKVIDYYLHGDFKNLKISLWVLINYNIRLYWDTLCIIKNKLIVGIMKK